MLSCLFFILMVGSRIRKISERARLLTTTAGTRYYCFIVIDLVSSKMVIMSNSPKTKP